MFFWSQLYFLIREWNTFLTHNESQIKNTYIINKIKYEPSRLNLVPRIIGLKFKIIYRKIQQKK